MKTTDPLFDKFWKAYPARNKKKVGKYPCFLWFKAYSPSVATVEAMINWIEQDKSNRAAVGEDKGFYANPKDPIRFLKDQAWTDPIGHINNAEEREAKRKADKRAYSIESWKKSLGRWIFDPKVPVVKVQRDSEYQRACQNFPEVKTWAIQKRPLLTSPPPKRKSAIKLSPAARAFREKLDTKPPAMKPTGFGCEIVQGPTPDADLPPPSNKKQRAITLYNEVKQAKSDGRIEKLVQQQNLF